MRLIKVAIAFFLILSLILPTVAFADDGVDSTLSKNETSSEKNTADIEKKESAVSENVEEKETLEETKTNDSENSEPIIIDEPLLEENTNSSEEAIIKEEDSENQKATIDEKELIEPETEVIEEQIEEEPETQATEEPATETPAAEEKEAEKPAQPRTMRSFSVETNAVKAAGAESNTSLLGHLRSSSVRIYEDYAQSAKYIEAGTTYTNAVYYIKKQASYNGAAYYLISQDPSSTSGLVGWVKASDMSTHTHAGVDRIAKTFYLKGTGSAFTKAWGGSKDLSVQNLSSLKNKSFTINLTEKVGNNIWYRGEINGKTAWVHEAFVAPAIESSTSRLGHLRGTDARIYQDLAKLADYTEAGTANTDEVYYIKKQAKSGNVLYYLISRNPSSTSGVVGWVKAADLSTHTHTGVDRTAKTFYLKGTGSAYDKAWGGSKNFTFQNLSKLKNQTFSVNLTEKVGNNIWYRGEINGKTAWVHEAFVTAVKPFIESSTSRLGHLRSASVRIYEDLAKPADYIEAGSAHTDEVYYIKKQAEAGNDLYYLISRNPSSMSGVVGWVKAGDLSTHAHAGIDRQAKTFYLKGTGSAYDKAWGGNKNLTYQDLSKMKDQAFIVNLTEKVGNNIWYRGEINGKTAWIHEAFAAPALESSTSRLGHLRSSSARIYKDLSKPTEYSEAGSSHTDEVYYIKKQALAGSELYYLISREPSSENGVVGWVKEADLSTHVHAGVDSKAKTFYLKGTGSAFDKAWGGSKNTVYSNLEGYKNAGFQIDLTEKVGTNTWYRGTLNGKKVWIHSAFLIQSSTTYTKYDITYTEALNRQMNGSPQTDKYRNSKAYIPKSAVKISETAAINDNGVRLRTAPNFNDNISTTVNSGTKVTVRKTVTGAVYAGSTKWYEIDYGGKILFVHTSLVNTQSKIGTALAKTNVYESASVNSHVFGTFAINANVKILNDRNGWLEVDFGDWRNAKRSDVDQYMNPDNNDSYQHLVLTSSAGVSASEINKILIGKGILEGKGQAFIDASKKHSVNEVYLISHALLETGQGNSVLATGVEVGLNSKGVATQVTASNKSSLTNIKKVYNMFGIQAFDNCALECGSEHAYTQNWDTPEKAIIGGASFIGEDYIHNKYGQNTIYKMRWNHIVTYKQYATDIGWAAKQTAQIRNFYSKLSNPVLRFDRPDFK